MGINGLNNFLKENIPDINTKVCLSKFKKHKIAIDTSIYLYKYKYNSNFNFIESFIKQLYRIKLNNITPIYIFDGKPPSEKLNIIKIRKKKKIIIIKKIKLLEEDIQKCTSLLEKIKLNEKIELLKKKLVIITDNDIIILKELFDIIGISYIQSETEADFLCNTLYKNNIIDMVLSEDNDFLVGGTKKLLKNFNMYSNKIILYDLDFILTKLNINNEQWIHFCILMGCDYCLKFHKLDSNCCLKLIKNYSINNIFIDKLNLNKEYITDFKKAKNLFLETKSLKIEKKDLFKGLFNKHKFVEFLKKNTSLQDKEINTIIKVINK